MGTAVLMAATKSSWADWTGWRLPLKALIWVSRSVSLVVMMAS